MKKVLIIIVFFCVQYQGPVKMNIEIVDGSMTTNQKVDPTIKILSTIDSVIGFYYIKGITGAPFYVSKNASLVLNSENPIYLMEPNNKQTGFYLVPGD